MTDLPAFLANRKKPLAVADTIFKSFGISLPPHVSIAGNHFTLVDGAGNRKPIPTVHLDAVIMDLNANKSRMYWGRNPDGSVKDYSDDNRVPPVCISDNGIGPSSRTPPTPGETGPTCAACPQAVWGSDVSFRGKAVPACTEGIKLAVLVPEHGAGLCFMLRIPPNSIKPSKQYAKMVKDQGLDLPDIVTRMTFVSGEMGKLAFEPVNYITEEIAALEGQLWDGKQTDTLVGRDDVPWQGAQQAIAVQQPAAMPSSPLPPPLPSFQPQPLQTTVPEKPLEQAPAKPRGRPKKEAAAEAVPDVPAFLQRTPPPPKPPGNAGFGMQQPSTMAADLKASMDRAFGKA